MLLNRMFVFEILATLLCFNETDVRRENKTYTGTYGCDDDNMLEPARLFQKLTYRNL